MSELSDSVDPDDHLVSAGPGGDIIGQFLDNVLVTFFKGVGNQRIEGDNRDTVAPQDPEVMETGIRMHGLYHGQKLAAKSIGFPVARFHRVNMYKALDAEFTVEAGFQLIDDLVSLKEGEIRGDFRMERYDEVSGAVVVDQKIMHIENARSLKHALCDLTDQFRVGGLSDKRACRVRKGLNAGIKDEKGNSEAAPAVETQPEFV